MARMSMMSDDASKLNAQASGGVKFFTLKDDGDSCRIRILYETTADVDGRTIHRVETSPGKSRNIDCLRAHYDDPYDMCPLCTHPNESVRGTQFKMWIPVYSVDTEEVMLWDRSGKFWEKVLMPLMVKYGEPFCGNIFTVVRHGRAGDSNTTYELIHEGVDETTLDDFDEIPSAEGVFFLEKTFDEMKKFVETGSFDGTNGDITDVPDIRRRTSPNDGVQRRTTRPNIV